MIQGATGEAVRTKGGALTAAKHTKGGLWLPQELCDLRGNRQGGAHTRRCTHKVVCGHRRSHVIKGPQARRYTHQAVHTQGETHKRPSMATARAQCA